MICGSYGEPVLVAVVVAAALWAVGVGALVEAVMLVAVLMCAPLTASVLYLARRVHVAQRAFQNGQQRRQAGH